MPGPAIKLPAVPDWADPNQASVFDMPGQGFLRQAVHLLGLDDPTTQAQMLMNPMEVGPVGGAMGAIAAKLPRFLKAVQSVYRAPTAAGRVAAPFYSRLDEAAATLPKQVFGPKVLGVVQKGQASGEELAARRVPEFVAGYGNKPIQRAALDAHLEAHPLPQLEVKTLGVDEFSHTERNRLLDQRAELDTYHKQLGEKVKDAYAGLQVAGPAATSEDMAAYDTLVRQRKEVFAQVKDLDRQLTVRPPKFRQYQLPGGTNYRETLITIPAKSDAPRESFETFVRRGAGSHADAVLADPRAIENWRRQYEGAGESWKAQSRPANEFRSSHFDEPNILVHTRSNERELPGLGKGAFLEEVQSDWHQKGKAEGYSTLSGAEKDRWLELDNIGSQSRALTAEEQTEFARLDERYGKGGRPFVVPDAPFKETWPDLALKHHLAEAAQNPEIQWLGFTSGETQAARYDLSKQIGALRATKTPDGRYAVEAFKDAGQIARGRREPLIIKSGLTADELPEVVGKEMATKIIGDLEHADIRQYTGLDLKVGGEGMHEFYDKLLPKRLEKIVKPFGGTVERVPIPTGAGDTWPSGAPRFAGAAARAKTEPGWIVRLTPELKKRLLEQGLPLMTGVAAAGATVPNSEEP